MGIRTAVCILLVAAVLAGCSSAKALTPAQFRSKANSECRALKRAGDQLELAGDPSATGKQITGLVSRAAAILRERVTAIDDFAVPDGLAERTDELVSALRRYADGLEDLGEQAKAGESFGALQRDHPKTVSRLNKLANTANTAASQLGLTECLA